MPKPFGYTKNLITLTIVLLCLQTSAQLRFHHLSMANGLSDNNVTCMAVDSSGFLWIGTADGLNVYNGYSITNYNTQISPALQDNHIEQVLCDAKNRLWIATSKGLVMADEHREFHTIALPQTDSTGTNSRQFLETTPSAGLIYFSGNICYRLPPGADALNPKSWQVLDWWKPFSIKQAIRDIAGYNNDWLIITTNRKIYVADMEKQQVVATAFQTNLRSACMLNDSIIVKMDYKGLVETSNLYTGQPGTKYFLKSIVNGKEILNSLYEPRVAANGEVLVTSNFAGLFRIDTRTQKVAFEAHDAGNIHSISSSDTRRLLCLPDGTVIISTRANGINITNLNQRLAFNKSIFTDAQKNLYDGPINGLLSDKENIMWLAGNNSLIQWNRATNKTVFINYPNTDSATGQNKATTIKAFALDSMHRLWVSGYDAGIAYYDKKKNELVALKYAKERGTAQSSDFIHDFLVLPDGIIWACSGRGIFSINPQTLLVQGFTDHPVLKRLNGVRTFDLMAANQQNVWMATESQGVFCYNEKKQTLLQYSILNGLSSNNCVALCQDNTSKIYVATDNGLNIIDTNGHIKIVNTKNGLRRNKCQALLKDADGNIWVANQKHLVKYHPADSSFIYYDNNAGLTDESFKNNAAFSSAEGMLYWGTSAGINYFLPNQLSPNPVPLKLCIAAIALPDTNISALFAQPLFFEHQQNNITIYFNAIDLLGSQNILYQYKLDGADNQWNAATDIGQVSYPALAPGKYSFLVKASKDGVNWISTAPLVFTIATPWYKAWWFIGICLVAIAAIIVFIVKKREQDLHHEAAQRAKEQKLESENLQYHLKIEQVLTAAQQKEIEIATLGQNLAMAQLTATRAQMNPHFIFNALNSVQQYILQGNVDDANKYLSKFSRLQREILNHCDQQFISLQKEADMLRMYVEFEQLRLNNSFQFRLDIAENIDADEIEIPPMVLQPFIENAIWHGLQPKMGAGQLCVLFALRPDAAHLQCTITDNGIGRKAAAGKNAHQPQHISKGLHLVTDRLGLLEQQYGTGFKATITDIYNADDIAAGTKVEIQFFIGH